MRLSSPSPSITVPHCPLLLVTRQRCSSLFIVPYPHLADRRASIPALLLPQVALDLSHLAPIPVSSLIIHFPSIHLRSSPPSQPPSQRDFPAAISCPTRLGGAGHERSGGVVALAHTRG